MQRIGNIKYLEVKTHDHFDDEHLIILFHGYGADYYDLQTLSDVITPPWNTRWIFPQGVLEVPIGPGWTGRAWWPINMEAIQQAAMRGEHRDLTQEYPEGLKKIRPIMLDFIKQLKTPMNKIVLGGFSQGAMLATDIFLHLAEPPKGLLLFSGALLCENDWKPLVAQKTGFPFFMSHGTNDPILSYKGSQRLETLFSQNGLKGQLHSFSGAHEIPMQIIQQANKYLQNLK